MKNQHSEQFSKSTVINARLQNAMGLFSLVIALSLAEVGQKRKNYHCLRGVCKWRNLPGSARNQPEPPEPPGTKRNPPEPPGTYPEP